MAENRQAALDEIGRLLAERYNVAAIDGPLAAALAAGDLDEIERLVGVRPMYRWAEPVAQAIAEARGHPEAVVEEAPEPITEPVPEPSQNSPSAPAEAQEPAPAPKKAGRGKK
jgi:hypothetical protein